MSYFDFPTWAKDKLSGTKPEAEPVRKMPSPTLDEIDAMNAQFDATRAPLLETTKEVVKKRGRPAKVKDGR